MSKPLSVVELGPEAIQYIERCLALGNSLADYLALRQDLKSGTVATYLPATIPAESATDFDESILPEPPPETHIKMTSKNGPVSRLVPKPNLDYLLVTVVKDFLQGHDEHVCIFEDAAYSPSDPAVLTGSTRILACGNEVYHCLVPQDAGDDDRIERTIRRARSWLFIGAMTSISKRFSIHRRTNVKKETLDALAQRAEKIVVGAYDGEGFLIWTKPPR